MKVGFIGLGIMGRPMAGHLLAAGHELFLNDVGTLPQNLGRLSKDDEIVVYCRSGARSGNAVQFLQRSGYEKAKNLAGGIHRWAERIDPTLPKY